MKECIDVLIDRLIEEGRKREKSEAKIIELEASIKKFSDKITLQTKEIKEDLETTREKIVKFLSIERPAGCKSIHIAFLDDMNERLRNVIDLL